MATAQSALLVTLQDRVSGPARAAASALRGIKAAMGSVTANLASMAAANSAAMSAMQTRMLAVGAAAYGFFKLLQAPIVAAGKFESIMLDIAQKSDLTDEQMKKLGERIRALAPIVNMTAQEVAQGMDVLTSMGLDPGRALDIMPALGKAATAYKAEMSDVAAMTYAAIDNLKVPVTETTRLLDILSSASKAGAFEFKDMARYFPALAARAKAAGESGIIGAARLASQLEVVRKGAGTNEEAATNLANVYQKAMSPETIKKFKKYGVDVVKVLDDARAKGEDVMEALATATMTALKRATPGGDEKLALSRMGLLFEDDQAQRGMTAFIQNWAEYRKILKELLGALGVVEADFNRRMLTFSAKMKAVQAAAEDLGITIGDILLPPIKDLLTSLKPAVDRLKKFSEAHPDLVGNLIKATAGIIGLRLAMVAGRFGYLQMKGLILGLLQPIASVVTALTGLRGALMLSGVGMILLAIGAAGKFISDNWSGLGVFFESFSTSLQKALGPETSEKLRPLLDALKNFGMWIQGGSWKIDDKTWAAWGDVLGTKVAPAIERIADLISAVMAMLGKANDAWDSSIFGGRKTKTPAATTTAPGGAIDPATSAAARAEASGRPVTPPPPAPDPVYDPVSGAVISAPVPSAPPAAAPDRERAPLWLSALSGAWKGIQAATLIAPLKVAMDEYAATDSGAAKQGLRASMPILPVIGAVKDAMAAPWTQSERPRKAMPRIIDNPPEVIGAPPGPAQNTGPVDELTSKAGEAKEGLDKLNATVSPTISSSSIDVYIAKLKEAARLAAQLGAVTIGGAVTVQPGGSVNSQVRAAFADNT